MIPTTISATAFWLGLGLVAYHHLIYPFVLRRLARAIRQRQNGRPLQPAPLRADLLPRITIVVPAYNEESHIRSKIDNLAALDYPADRLSIIIASDGSTDRTVAVAQNALAALSGLPARLVDDKINRGKTEVLNRLLPTLDGDIIVLSDVSSAVAPDCLKRYAAHFADERVGVVCGAYQLEAPLNEGERFYWEWQVAQKRDEATVAAMMGAHGAFYAIRGGLFTPLEEDTINDDFVIPMRIVEQGYRTVYDTSIILKEREATGTAQDFRRRVRLSAGAMQQFLRLTSLFDPRRPGIAFVFASGKALRALTPFLLAMMLVTSLVLTAAGDEFFSLPLLGLAILLALGLLQLQENLGCVPKALHPFAYLAAGHMAGLVGGTRYLLTSQPGSKGHSPQSEQGVLDLTFMTPATRRSKRAFDIVCASIGLVGFVLVFPIIALAIKLESPGPIFYRQLRVGERTPTQTKLFLLNKFRTMRVDAEKLSGAVWAKKNDSRITFVGNFLRKTRLDEIPQFFNVLVGDMSIVGPRPERPCFFARLEREIPYYSERTYGVRPGITGLAQVRVGYDQCVEDVREKVLHDHVYATRLSTVSDWIKTDLAVCFRTCAVVVLGKGQ